MLAVLHLDPVLGPPGLIGAVTPLSHQAFKAHPTRGLEQLRPDLALFERCGEDAVRSPRRAF